MAAQAMLCVFTHMEIGERKPPNPLSSQFSANMGEMKREVENHSTLLKILPYLLRYCSILLKTLFSIKHKHGFSD